MHVEVSWHTKKDGHKICPICTKLDEFTWVFRVGEGVFPAVLTHPVYGVVWNFGSGSAVHGFHGMKGDCQCSITYKLELSDLLEKITMIADRLEEAFLEGDFKGRSYS